MKRISILAKSQTNCEAPPNLGFELYTINMGTGIVAVLAPRLSPTLAPLASELWDLNACLFLTFTVLLIVQSMRRATGLMPLLRDKRRSMLSGALPMAISSIANGIFLFHPHLLGSDTQTLALAMLVASGVLALATGLIIPHLMFTTHRNAMGDMNMTWLLPLVPAEVTAFETASLIPHLAHSLQMSLLWGGYLLWAWSVPLALSILTIALLRLSLHQLPDASLATSTWLALGPLGTGSAALLTLGMDSSLVLRHTPLAYLIPALQGIGVVGGMALWAYGIWWWLSAIGISVRYLAEGNYPFNLGWWGFTFPLGVLTTATFQISSALHSEAFSVAARGMTVLLVSLWLVVSTKTILHFLDLSKHRRHPVTGARNFQEVAA